MLAHMKDMIEEGTPGYVMSSQVPIVGASAFLLRSPSGNVSFRKKNEVIAAVRPTAPAMAVGNM